MATPSSRLDLLLNSIDENCTPEVYEPLLLPFMIDCADMIASRMSTVAADAFRIVKTHNGASSQSQELMEAVQRCWQSLGQRNMSLDDPGVSATRAVICILHVRLRRESDEFIDGTSFFLQLINNVEPHIDEQEALLRKYFGHCL